MKIIHINRDFKAENNNIIALGNFDGVHIAHRALLDRCVDMSKELKVESSLLIFKNHTRTVLFNKKQQLLTSNKQKYNIFKNIGIDYIFEMDFTEEIMNLSPEDFFYNLLLDGLLVKGIVVGFDYRFGKKASGDINLLKKLCIDNDIKLFVVKPVKDGNDIVSSTMIRSLIVDGNIKKANELLNYDYTMNGKIVHGKHLGTKMGYPTANIQLLENYVIPKFGVYDSDVIIEGKSYKAATNIGKNPTIENDGIRIEAHILDFNQDIYDKEIDLVLKDFIRPELKFDSIEELFEKISEDSEIVRNRSL